MTAPFSVSHLRASAADVDRGVLVHRAKIHAAGLVQAISPAELGVIASVHTAEPAFVMTYDDGPNPDFTPELLATLARWEGRAVFFMLLNNVRAHPDLVQAIGAAGHEVGLHGLDHRPILHTTAAELGSRLTVAKTELEQLTGQPVRWFRPPHGLIDRSAHRVVRGLGMVPVHWNRTGWDWNPTSAARREAVATIMPRRGNIILLHDVPNEADPGLSIVEAVALRGHLSERILSAYAERGLRSRTLSELTERGTPNYRFQLNRSTQSIPQFRKP